EKLAGERGGRFDLGDDAVRSEQEGGGAVAVLLLRLALGGPEAAIRRHGDRLLRAAAHAVGRLQERAEAGRRRLREIGGADLHGQTSRRADGRGIELLPVGRRGGGEE